MQALLRERRFRAMGCECQVLSLGGTEESLEAAVARVRALEACWTRFDDDSELSRFNRSVGHFSAVSNDLMVLLSRSLEGYRLSSGLFDPFLGDRMVSTGYDRDFELLAASPVPQPSQAAAPQPAHATHQPVTLTGLLLDQSRGQACLSPGLVVDSGGIGKGLGAEMTVQWMLAAGFTGAMVSLGGDVAVGGDHPDEGWRIGVADPFGRPDADLIVALRSGALCSSGTLQRRWTRDDGTVAHHILDPATGEPLVDSAIVAASAIAPHGWLAEVLTKEAIVGGMAAAQRIVERHPDCALVLWGADGEMTQRP